MDSRTHPRLVQYQTLRFNVSDLKSMIDLMTDKSPEKQKYGIAMFEYLARKGKVPVEFLTAQIDYAKTADNHELLPMLEVAILNAAKENPKLAQAYRLALAASAHLHPSQKGFYQAQRLRSGDNDQWIGRYGPRSRRDGVSS